MKLYCRAPFTGPTIDPMGNITLCCASKDRNFLNAKINDIENLQDFFKGPKYEEIRNIVALKGVEGLGDHCTTCMAAKLNNPLEFTPIDTHARIPIDSNRNITHLELTSSNVCNQTCATCSSVFSSKWRKIHHLFHNTPPASTYNMSDAVVQTTIDTISTLKYLCLKGGEPTADKNNVRILNEVARLNPNLEINIVTNFQEISNDWWYFFKVLPNMNITISVDGTGLLYNWIRGGDWDTILLNIEKYITTIGKLPIINPVISIYNIFNLAELYNTFDGWAKIPGINNVVIDPAYASIFMINQDRLKQLLIEEYGSLKQPFLPRMMFMNQPGDYTDINKSLEFINAMNKYRKISLFDCEPKLEKLFDELINSHQDLAS